MVDVVHVLDEADTACPKCGGELAPWDGHFEEAEEIDVVERSFRIVCGAPSVSVQVRPLISPDTRSA
jgi:hypothetical protein